MKPEDYPQFPDPRVREVLAAAANLCAKLVRRLETPLEAPIEELRLIEALAAVTHRPKSEEDLCLCKYCLENRGSKSRL